jgi:hypothetical protein
VDLRGSLVYIYAKIFVQHCKSEIWRSMHYYTLILITWTIMSVTSLESSISTFPHCKSVNKRRVRTLWPALIKWRFRMIIITMKKQQQSSPPGKQQGHWKQWGDLEKTIACWLARLPYSIVKVADIMKYLTFCSIIFCSFHRKVRLCNSPYNLGRYCLLSLLINVVD